MLDEQKVLEFQKKFLRNSKRFNDFVKMIFWSKFLKNSIGIPQSSDGFATKFCHQNSDRNSWRTPLEFRSHLMGLPLNFAIKILIEILEEFHKILQSSSNHNYWRIPKLSDLILPSKFATRLIRILWPSDFLIRILILSGLLTI